MISQKKEGVKLTRIVHFKNFRSTREYRKKSEFIQDMMFYIPVEVLLSSVQSTDRLGRRTDMRDDSAEILFQSFLQEVLVSSSGIGKYLHS